MVKKLSGYTLAIIGAIGYGFFRNHNSSVFEHSIVLFYLSIAIGIFGLYLIYTSKNSLLSKREKHEAERAARIIRNGEKIILTLENCSIKENNYYEEVTDNSLSQASVADALYDPNRNVKKNYIKQTAIVYYYQHSGEKLRLTSQTFPYNGEELRGFIYENRIILYLNRFDKTEYIFDLKD